VNVRNHVIGTAIIKIRFRIGAKSTKYGQSPVRVIAKTPVTKVAKWFLTYPITN
jgi:hypothetical protein